MDDGFSIQRQNASKTAHIKFAKCLSAVDARLKLTYETEENNQMPFLDALLMPQPDGSIKTKIYRKASNTGLTIQPKSNQDPNAWIGVLKGALCRAYRLCSDPSLIKEEIQYLTNNFVDNGFNVKH